MVVVGKEGIVFVVCWVVLPSGKAVDATTEGTVPTCGDGVITKDWPISIEQEETAMTKMSDQGITKCGFKSLPS